MKIKETLELIVEKCKHFESKGEYCWIYPDSRIKCDYLGEKVGKYDKNRRMIIYRKLCNKILRRLA